MSMQDHRTDLSPSQAALLSASLADCEDAEAGHPVLCLNGPAIEAAMQLTEAGFGHISFTARNDQGGNANG